MEQVVDRMVSAYEAGKITRRQLVLALAALPAAGLGTAAAAESPFKGLSLNHVTFRVTNLQRSTEFYKKLLGVPFLHTNINGSNYLGLGDSFICLGQGREGAPAAIDHFCIGIENFDADKAIDRLHQEGLETRTNAKGEVYFVDPDGLRVQLSSTKYNGEGRG